MSETTSKLALAIVVTTLASAEVARAAPTEASDAGQQTSSLGDSLSGEARTAYDEGRVLLFGEQYQRAYAKFELAYERSKDARLLWNMAVAEKSLHHYLSAQSLLRRYLVESHDLSAEDRTAAENLIKTFDLLTGQLTVAARPDGASVFIDKKQISTTAARPVILDLGEHELVVTKPGFRDFQTTFSVEPHESYRAEIELAHDGEKYPNCSRTLLSWVPSGRIRVAARAQARVFIDDVESGTGHVECVVPAGRHTVSVSTMGEQTYIATAPVDVVRDRVSEVAGRKSLSVLADERPTKQRASDLDSSSQALDDETVKPGSHGCGCRMTSSHTPVPAALVAAVVLALGARRRRSTSVSGRHSQAFPVGRH